MDKMKDDWGIIQTWAFLFQLPLLALSVAITHRFGQVPLCFWLVSLTPIPGGPCVILKGKGTMNHPQITRNHWGQSGPLENEENSRWTCQGQVKYEAGVGWNGSWKTTRLGGINWAIFFFFFWLGKEKPQKNLHQKFGVVGGKEWRWCWAMERKIIWKICEYLIHQCLPLMEVCWAVVTLPKQRQMWDHFRDKQWRSVTWRNFSERRWWKVPSHLFPLCHTLHLSSPSASKSFCSPPALHYFDGALLGALMDERLHVKCTGAALPLQFLLCLNCALSPLFGHPLISFVRMLESGLFFEFFFPSNFSLFYYMPTVQEGD